MKKFYLFDYLKENADIDKSKLDLLQYELDQRIYYYGDNFSNPKEKKISYIQNIKLKFKAFLKNIFTNYSILTSQKVMSGKIVVSNAYFSVNQELAKQKINIFRPVHNISKDFGVASNLAVYKNYQKIDKAISLGDYKLLISDGFSQQLDEFTESLKSYYSDIKVDALIVPNDLSFYEQLNIKIFKQLKKPSFIFLHGLPGRYNIYDDNQTDYLIVWGKKIKQNYVNIGFDANKILISGHPFYNKLDNGELRNSLDDILVLSVPLAGAQYRDDVRLSDRGNLIIYLCSIEKILKKFGVKQVRLRVHPSENIDWYYKFIDNNFFIADKIPLSDSLKRSTLVIGSMSTVFLEAMYYGVNYIIYEPTIGSLDLVGYNLVPPFDGSDSKALVAQNEVSLEQMIKERAVVDRTIFNDYIDTPFNINCITDLI